MGDTRTINTDIEAGENDPFLKPNDRTAPTQPQQTWWGAAAHYFSQGVKTATAFVVAIPTAIYSLVMLSGSSPNEISIDWWDSMSTAKRIFSAILAAASMDVNTRLNNDFFGQVWDKLKKNLRRTFHSVKEFMTNVTSTVMGFCGGLTAAALAYEAFLWAGQVFANFFAMLNMVSYTASRFIGVHKALELFFNRDISNAQIKVVDEIKHIKPEYLTELQDVIDQASDTSPKATLSDEDFEAMFMALAQKLAELKDAHPDNLFNEKTMREHAARYAGALFDYTFATMVAATTLVAFAPKGLKGVEISAEVLNADLTGLNQSEKIAIGTAGASPSVLLYFISALYFRQLSTDAAKYLYQHPEQIPSFSYRLICNGFASSSMFVIAANSLTDDNNLFGLPVNAANYWLIASLGAIDSLTVNFGSALKTFRDKSPDSHYPTVQQISKRFETPYLRTVSRQAAKNGLLQNTVFAKGPTEVVVNPETPASTYQSSAAIKNSPQSTSPTAQKTGSPKNR